MPRRDTMSQSTTTKSSAMNDYSSMPDPMTPWKVTLSTSNLRQFLRKVPTLTMFLERDSLSTTGMSWLSGG